MFNVVIYVLHVIFIPKNRHRESFSMVFSMVLTLFDRFITQYNIQMLQNKEIFWHIITMTFSFIDLTVFTILTLLFKGKLGSSIIFSIYFATTLREFGQCSNLLKCPFSIDCHTMNNVYLKSSKNTNNMIASNSPSRAIGIGSNHCNGSFGNDTENHTDHDVDNRNRPTATKTAMQLHLIHALTTANNPNYETDRATNSGINNFNSKANDFSIPTSLTLHSKSYSRYSNVSNVSGTYVSPPAGKLCPSTGN